LRAGRSHWFIPAIVYSTDIDSFPLSPPYTALRGDSENTPLKIKLNDLAELTAKLSSVAGLLLFTALMIRFFVQLGTNDPVRYVGASLHCPFYSGLPGALGANLGVIVNEGRPAAMWCSVRLLAYDWEAARSIRFMRELPALRVSPADGILF
jgi:hypothetical protein